MRKIREAKVELLSAELALKPHKFASQHPFATHIGKIIIKGGKKFGRYALEKKAQQLREEGKAVAASRLEARAKKIKV